MKAKKEKQLYFDFDDIGAVVDFLKYYPDNVYRTEHFIVAQHLTLTRDDDYSNVLMSEDLYYARNEERDDDFDCLMKGSRYPEGRRISTQTYVRSYIR